jgi:hypothetical protein
VVSFPQVSPSKPYTRLSPPPSALHARPSHSSRFYHQTMKLVIMKFSPLPCYLVPLRPKYSP